MYYRSSHDYHLRTVQSIQDNGSTNFNGAFLGKKVLVREMNHIATFLLLSNIQTIGHRIYLFYTIEKQKTANFFLIIPNMT